MNLNLYLKSRDFDFKLTYLYRLSLMLILLLSVQNTKAQSFPCGEASLNLCACEGSNTLIADSEPCTFNSAQMQEYILVDIANAVISSDDDNGAIVAISDNGVFNNVPTGDYTIYNVMYSPVDQSFFDAQLENGNTLNLLLELGTEGPAGVWNADVPNFTIVASELATVNGPECDCSQLDISDPCSCESPENFVSSGVNYVYETITINAPSGQTWTLNSTQSAGMYYGNADLITNAPTATEVVPGEYEFSFFHVPGVGYTAYWNNGIGEQLSISALGLNCICDLEECESLTTCDSMDFCTEEQQAITICPDFCADGTFTYKNISTVYHCSVVPLGNDGNCFEYTPLPGMEFIGSDVIDLLAVNENGDCIEQSINISIGNCNNPPTAEDDYYESDGSSVEITPISNDFDVDGDFVYVCGYYSDPVNGTLILTNGLFTYTPNAGFVGVDYFEYTICDGNGEQASATVYIETSEIPTCDNGTLSLCTDYMTPLYLCPDFCMFNEGENYMISSSFSTYSCALYIMEEDCVRYTPIPGFYGNDLIQIVACSTEPGHSMWCDTVYAEITVVEDCDDFTPIDEGEENETPTDEPCSADVSTCTLPMTPVDLCVPFCTDGLSIVNAQTTYSCSVSLLGSNCIRFVAVPGFIGTSHITVEACDQFGNCETAIVSVDVTDDCDMEEISSSRLGNTSICDIKLPEAFVPYAMGNDGSFAVENLTECTDIANVKFTVYNINGQVIHNTTDISSDVLWNANEHNWTDGMYIYALEIESEGVVERKTGYINIVR